MKKHILAFICSTMFVLLITSCSDNRKGNETATTGRTERTTARTDTVAHKTDTRKAEITSPASKGVIESVTDVPVYSLVTSVVTDVNVKQGQTVTPATMFGLR